MPSSIYLIRFFTFGKNKTKKKTVENLTYRLGEGSIYGRCSAFFFSDVNLPNNYLY